MTQSPEEKEVEETRGRKTVVTPQIVMKLESAFSIGCTDLEACFFANISKTALYEHQKRDLDFTERKEELKKRPVFKARMTMLELMDSEDEHIQFKASSETLNRYEGKAKERLEISGKDGGAIHTVNSEMTPKEAAQAFKDQIKDS